MPNGKLESLINIVERLSQRVNDLELLVAVLKTKLEQENHRTNSLEVCVDNLRVELKLHSHPYQPEPRYGGTFGD